jgi:ABC-type phosphate/phosphonate transport system ATPase subunit
LSTNIPDILQQLYSGDKRALARCITLVENEWPGYEQLLQQLTFAKNTPVIGITGPPGAGKSTLCVGSRSWCGVSGEGEASVGFSRIQAVWGDFKLPA